MSTGRERLVSPALDDVEFRAPNAPQGNED